MVSEDSQLLGSSSNKEIQGISRFLPLMQVVGLFLSGVGGRFPLEVEQGDRSRSSLITAPSGSPSLFPWVLMLLKRSN